MRSPHPPVACDLCESVMSIPEGAVDDDGLIRGMLVCTACIEDNLYATADEPRCELGLVGGRV